MKSPAKLCTNKEMLIRIAPNTIRAKLLTFRSQTEIRAISEVSRFARKAKLFGLADLSKILLTAFPIQKV